MRDHFYRGGFGSYRGDSGVFGSIKTTPIEEFDRCYVVITQATTAATTIFNVFAEI